jgi:hypothetical protein
MCRTCERARRRVLYATRKKEIQNGR